MVMSTIQLFALLSTVTGMLPVWRAPEQWGETRGVD